MVTENKIQSDKGVITLYRIQNDTGAYVELSSLGAGIVSVVVPDRSGIMKNVALRYKNIGDYLDDGPCMGKIPGRYANRIAKGVFKIGDNEYHLTVNNGPNALHGGPEGFQNQIWESEPLPDGVRFTYKAVDGEEHYPGNVIVIAEYHWSNSNVLTINLTAETDKPTVINLTNHAYWNLDGSDAGSVLDHIMKMKASSYLPTDETLIPTGEILSVKGTPMDFTLPKTLGKDIKEDFPALNYGKGYDACWAIDDAKENKLIEDVVELISDKSGRRLRVSTDQPGVQIYTGNWLSGSPENESGSSYDDYDGVAVEAQGFPDAPNKKEFPSQIIKPGEKYVRTIKFSFDTI